MDGPGSSYLTAQFATDTRFGTPDLYLCASSDLSHWSKPSRVATTQEMLDEEPLEVDIATTLLYEHCHHSYRQIRQAVQVSGERYRREIIDLGLGHRGRYDEMSRGFRAGQ